MLLSWLGYPLYKCPFDIWTYQEIIADTRPQAIVECGTRYGGGALFMAGLFDLIGAGHVITIDIDTSIQRPPHRRITYLTGSTLDPELFERVRTMTAGRRTMVILDSDHSAPHVAKELELYPDLVTPGCYLIVDDTDVNGHPVVPEHGPGPMEALDGFLAKRADFQPDAGRERFMLSLKISKRWPFLSRRKSTAALGLGKVVSAPGVQVLPPSCDSERTNQPSFRGS